MSFCSNCGNKIENEDKFCSNCGTPIKENNSEKKREIVFEGTIHKCPNCGEVLNSFVTNCPACGYELRSLKNLSAVAELASKLEEIENSREEETEADKRRRAFYGDVGVGLSKTDEQKISLIRNFPIPNTKEDLYEFLILSKSNIDIGVYEIARVNSARYAISEAWKSKFEQAYLKAKILLKNDDRMVEINTMHEAINKSINNAKLSIGKMLGILLGIPLAVLLLIIIFSMVMVMIAK